MSEEEEIIGPALPPSLLAKRKAGPSLDDVKPDLSSAPAPVVKKRKVGPSLDDLLPAGNKEEDEEDDLIGPPPLSAIDQLPETNSKTEQEIDDEWQQVMNKHKIAEEDKKIQREGWMLSLPQKKLQQQTENQRNFSKSGIFDLDDSWTRTPGQKNAPKEAPKSSVNRPPPPRVITAPAAPTQPRGPTLLEIHQSKLQKDAIKKSAGGGSGERRPWNRETDLAKRL